VDVARGDSFGYHELSRTPNGMDRPHPRGLNVWMICRSERHLGRLRKPLRRARKEGRKEERFAHQSVVERGGTTQDVLPAFSDSFPVVGDRDPTCFGLQHTAELFLLMMTATRSPTTPRSEVSSPRPKFDSEMLKAYMKELLPATLRSSVWPSSKDRGQVKLWIKEIGERVKGRMLGV
jgi:hypothetical protein